MKIGWVTHRDLASLEGGAEMGEQMMISLAPQGVLIDVLGHEMILTDVLRYYDKLVVTGTEGFTSGAVAHLVRTPHAVWQHSIQTRDWPRKRLFETAEPFVALNPMHLEEELKFATHIDKGPSLAIPSPFDHTKLYPEPKEDYAIWPHRNVWHKGWDRALAWSKETGIELMPMTDRPADEVYSYMRRAKYMVLLSHIFDAGPRTVMEAQLCECELVIDNVGWWENYDAHAIRHLLDDAPRKFWRWVCG